MDYPDSLTHSKSISNMFFIDNTSTGYTSDLKYFTLKKYECCIDRYMFLPSTDIMNRRFVVGSAAKKFSCLMDEENIACFFPEA